MADLLAVLVYKLSWVVYKVMPFCIESLSRG